MSSALPARAQRLVAALPQGFEAALIGTPQNRFYLLDFDAHDAGHLLLLPDKMVYLVDSRYIEAARRQIHSAEVLLEKDALGQLGALLEGGGVRQVFLEDGISVAVWKRLKKRIQFVDFNISNTLSNLFANLRAVKDAGELERMRKAQAITDACFEHVLPFIKEGVREIDLALEMDCFMRKNGADGLAFETICLTGPNTSRPHGVPGETRVQKGDFVTMDFGARVQGYCADMTRTVALGEPGEEKRHVYATVRKAHLAGIAAAKAGQTGQQVDKAARDSIAKAGYGAAFGHGLGHSLGIEVHEEPRFSPRELRTMRAGMVLSVEPGIYLEGRFGCRIEDTVVLGENGCAPLPKSGKELLVL